MINNTDVIWSIVAIGRPLGFPLSINLVNIPFLTSSPATDVVQYLRLISNDYRFFTEMLKILLDNRREHHHKRAKRGHSQLDFKPGRLVIHNVLIYLDAENDIVGKSSYQTRGPFIVLYNTNHASYIIKKTGWPKLLKKEVHEWRILFYLTLYFTLRLDRFTSDCSPVKKSLT